MENKTSFGRPADAVTEASRLSCRGVDFALAVVVETDGETPRKPGAKMIVTSAGEIYGTVGGGAVESGVIERARKLLAERGKPEIMEWRLDGVESGICGGRMRIYIEPFFAPRQIVIFGAGHVSAALCPVLASLGFSVAVYDDRKDRFLLSEFKSVRQIAAPYSDLEKHLTFHKELNILVMTPNHAYDFEVVKRVLTKEWAFLGVLASRKKRAEFITRLNAEGFPADLIASVRMPLGIDIGSETPAEIAISIAAEFVGMYSTKKK
jgi:xanthine dehydrogenase accessory factor